MQAAETLRNSQEEAQELSQALKASAEEVEEARRDAAAHEDAAADFLEELDQSRAERASVDSQLTDAKVQLF